MSLSAQIRTDALGNITVQMRGGLDFENGIPFQNELQNILQENPKAQVILDMLSVEFVGSSGINHFVDTIKALNTATQRLFLSNVKQEFLRVFKLYNFDALDLIIDQVDNEETEHLNKMFGNRSRTFQN